MTTRLLQEQSKLFGKVQAFVGGIEIQGKRALHVYLVAFLDGFLSIIEGMQDLMLNTEHFKNKLIPYFPSAVSATSLVDAQAMECPSCGSEDSITRIPISNSGWKIQARKVFSPLASRFSICTGLFGEVELIQERIKHLKNIIISMKRNDFFYYILKFWNAKNSRLLFEGSSSNTFETCRRAAQWIKKYLMRFTCWSFLLWIRHIRGAMLHLASRKGAILCKMSADTGFRGDLFSKHVLT